MPVWESKQSTLNVLVVNGTESTDARPDRWEEGRGSLQEGLNASAQSRSWNVNQENIRCPGQRCRVGPYILICIPCRDATARVELTILGTGKGRRETKSLGGGGGSGLAEGGVDG